MNASSTVAAASRGKVRGYLDEVAHYFALGEVRQFQKIETGHSSTNYFLTTSSGEYVVRFFSDFNKGRFTNELTVQKVLKEYGIDANCMLESTQNDFMYKKGNTYATVSKRIAGHHPERPVSDEEAALVGRALGYFHKVIDPMPISLDNRYLFVKRQRLQDELDGLIAADDLNDIRTLFAFSSGVVEEDLPQGILHGDLHADNVLIDGEHVAMLDLQSVGKGQYILDVGRSIADICSEYDQMNVAKIESFLKGYQLERKLSSAELKSLGRAIIFGAVCVASWAHLNEIEKLAIDFMRIGKSTMELEKAGALSFE